MNDPKPVSIKSPDLSKSEADGADIDIEANEIKLDVDVEAINKKETDLEKDDDLANMINAAPSPVQLR